MRDEKSDGSSCSSGRGFCKWKASCNGVESIMNRGNDFTNYIPT